MIKDGAKIDRFIAVTDVVTVADDPKLEVIYKLAEIEINGKIIPTMKWAPGKRSLPGKKQVFRSEKFDGRPERGLFSRIPVFLYRLIQKLTLG